MKNIYDAKEYFQEVLLGNNQEGKDFLNESFYFNKAFNFSGLGDTHDYSDSLISIGVLNDYSLEVGIHHTFAKKDILITLKNNIAKKLHINSSSIQVIPEYNYQPYLLSSGQKVGHVQLMRAGSYGTLGSFLIPTSGQGLLKIVSNNHVLANSNNARIGDDIYSLENIPSIIGSLRHFHPINPQVYNKLDLAVADVNTVGRSQFRSKYRLPQLGEVVYKNGATTGTTVGNIRSLNYSAKVNYGTFDAIFIDQIQIVGNNNSVFSAPGDSGSFIWSSFDKTGIGLLFAGNPKYTLANHNSDVIEKLQQWGYKIN